MKHNTLTVLLLLASALCAFAQKGGECATCKGKRETNCFTCEGKGTFEAPCPLCLGRDPVDCLNCAAKGSVICRKCENEDRAGSGGSSRNCVVCKGRHTLPCRLCERGKLPCGACKGTQKVKRGCTVCTGLKKLPCPDCGQEPETCPACKGEKNQTCPICQGTKKSPTQCVSCRGAGYSACGNCWGLGQSYCQNCNHLGRVESAICPKCRGKAMIACTTCKGKGGAPCVQCAGEGGDGPCWACGSKGTISCLRCAEPRKVWRGKDEATGVSVVVLSVQDFEPHVIAGLRMSFPMLQPVLWRVVIDARESKSPFPLGDAKGWQLTGVELSDRTCVVGPSRLPSTDEARYAAFLGLCGLGKDAGKYPVSASPSKVLTVVLWEGGDPDPSMKEFTLRKGAGESQFKLEEGTATWSDWARLMSVAKGRR